MTKLYENMTLTELKDQKKAVENRIAIAKGNLSTKAQITSPTLLALVREDVMLAHLIASWIPHDYTPNPGGSSGTPMGALAHA